MSEIAPKDMADSLLSDIVFTDESDRVLLRDSIAEALKAYDHDGYEDGRAACQAILTCWIYQAEQELKTLSDGVNCALEITATVKRLRDQIRTSGERYKAQQQQRELADRALYAIQMVEKYRLTIKRGDNNRWIVDPPRSGFLIQHEVELIRAYCDGVLNFRERWADAVFDAVAVIEAAKKEAGK